MSSKLSKALPPIPAFQRQNSILSSHSTSRRRDVPLSSSGKTSLDFTQRVERKLAEHNASDNVLKRWLFEMISWLVSALCMGAIIGIYIRINNQRMIEGEYLLTWTNALSKVASAALIVPTTEALGQLKWNWFHKSNVMWDFEIFDKASRGLLGAMMLLFRTKGRSLAALGALLIVLLLAIDTFFQQIVELPSQWTLQHTAGEVPKTTHYQPSIQKAYRDGAELAQDDDDMFLVVQKFSFANGTQPVKYGNGTRPEIPLTCPTSNCTWPLYETIGVCSHCTDISSHLTFSCLTNIVDWTVDLVGGYGIEGNYPNTTMCRYFLNATSDNPVMMSGYLLDTQNSTKGEALIMRIFPLTTIYDREPLYGNGSINLKHLRNTIADAVIVSAANGSVHNVYENMPPVAHECALSWCVKTIRSSYEEGKYQEDILETYFNTTAGENPWLAYPYETPTDNGTDIYYLQDINIEVDTDSEGRNISRYGTPNETAVATILGFVDIFPATSTAKNLSAAPILRYKTWSLGPAFQRQLEFNPWIAPNNVSRHMERLATAMTNLIRSTDHSNEMVLGSAYDREVFINIRWGGSPFLLRS